MSLSQTINKNIYIILITSLIGLLVAFNSVFVVHERENAFVLQFGSPVKTIKNAGLNFKVPFMQKVIYFDYRLLDFDADPIEVISSDKKRLIVDAFMRYKIVDPLKVFQTTLNERGSESRLKSILESSLRQIIGGVEMNDLFSDKRTSTMNKILTLMQQEAVKFGIEVVDVRIKMVDLPAENSNAIYRRMQTERNREAKEIRSQGESEAIKIRAISDRKKQEILADAYRQAQIIKGSADGEVIKIYANSFGRDKEFFEFYRKMELYKNDVNGKEMIMSDKGVFDRAM